jgi:hypothetical protein
MWRELALKNMSVVVEKSIEGEKLKIERPKLKIKQ